MLCVIGLSNIVVECDALSVIQSLQFPQFDFYLFEMIIEDCKAILSQLKDAVYVFVKRFANNVVHTIAIAAYYVIAILGVKIGIGPSSLYY